MTNLPLLDTPFPWDWVWQTTACLLLGVAVSAFWAGRAARAHQALLLGMVAGLAAPLLSGAVRYFEWGAFVRPPAAVLADGAAGQLPFGPGVPLPGMHREIGEGAAPSASPLAREPHVAPAAAGAAAATSVEAGVSSWSWGAAFGWAWAVLTAVVGVRLFCSMLQGRRVLAGARLAAEGPIRQALARAGAELGLRELPEISVSDAVRCPLIWCWGRHPRLVLPTAALRPSAAVDWFGVMCHELAHWKRRDHLTGLFAELVVCLLPWQPLAWWAKRRLAQLSERACDDWALASGQAPTTYAESLVNLVPQRKTALVMAAVTSRNHLRARLRHILQGQRSDPRPGRTWVCVATLGTVLLVAAVALAQTRGTLAAPAGADEKAPAQVPVQPAAAAPAAGQRADGKAAGTVTARKLWDGLAQQPFSAVSPDGRHLTYMDPSGYLAVRDVVTGKDRRLTPKGFGDGGAYPGSNVFSPDGRQVAYSWYDPPAPRELRLIAFDGSQDRLLYRNEEVPSLWPSAWTPDGKSLVALFQRKDKTYQIALVAVADGAMRVLKSFPDWRRPERVSLSPDGRYLLYDFPPQADARQTDLFLLAIDGSRETAVAEHPSHDLALGWAPDGKQILFSSGRSETGRPEGNLWLLPVADGKAAGEPVRVPGDLSWGMPIGIARDGSYYFTRHSSTVDVHVASLHPTTRKLVVPPTPAGKLYGIEGRIDFFNWSLDGQQLVYQRRAGELVIRSAASGAERVLKPDLGQMYLLPHYSQVCWSPDGRSLFASPYNPKDGQRRLVGVRIDAQTGQVTPFTPALELVQSEVVAFSPDGKSLFRVQHEADSSRLLMRDLGTGQEKEMLQLKKPHGITFPCLSPDGRKLAFRSTESTPDVKLQSTRLMVMPVTGGEPREVLRLQMPDYIPGFSGMFVWTSDGRDLLFVNGGARDANAERGFQLWRVPAEGGAPENLGVAMPHLKHLRIHPDGKQIAFLGGESGTEFWVLENLWPARK